MNNLKKQEKALLDEICHKYDLPLKLVEEVIKSAEVFSYENASSATKRKEYLDLINYYSKKNKGD